MPAVGVGAPGIERERLECGRGEAVNEGRETGDLGFCFLYTPFQQLGSYGPHLGLIY